VKAGVRILAPALLLLTISAAGVSAADRNRGTGPQCEGRPEPYRGVVIDAMSQIDEKMNFADAIRMVRAAGINRLALFARSRKSLGDNEAQVLSLASRNPDLIVVGAPKYFLSRGDLDGRFIDATMKGIRDNHYAFIGEILYTHGDKSHGEQTADGERFVDPAEPGTAKLLAALKGSGVPLMTHWEVYDWDRDWPAMHKLYADWPEQTFIIPHMAFGSPAQVRTILDSHPNVVMTISKKAEPQTALSDEAKGQLLGEPLADRCGRLDAEWKNTLEAYRDRLMFATDAHKNFRWLDYGRHADNLRGVLSQLSPEAAAAIAHLTAERVYRLKPAG
jgi:hypothetical protein